MTQDELPRRPRRRLATPVTATLCAVLIAALGFIGGVQVQKAAGDASPATPARFAARGGLASGAGAGGGGAASDATVGSVANLSGHTIYVTDSGGNTIRVKTNTNSKVTRTAVSSVGAIHPGDSVIVQGTTSSGGTVTATSITATAKNATGSLFGGIRPSGGAAPAGG